ncbi:hypothetical protein [Streptomyces sp. AK04-3B]|uniref:hypothetical protein n=1 Tax=unclassified Streptomyces TaxID=2593676 RepID=UPI0029A6CBFE|nr:hypothetical protein [Streptomyces sp. AK04-3B]MDX3800483.1 hypothetical protein [Streptomyces sp. AK04-3B]
MPSGLPPIGAEIPCRALAVDTPLQIRKTPLSVDFRGGWRHRVDVNPDAPIHSARLRLTGFRMTAEIPPLNGGAEGGAITIEQNDVDADPGSLLRLTQQFPPRYECLLALDTCTMTIDQPGSEPLLLTPKGQFLLVAQLTQYPPRGDQYQLKNPVDFTEPDEPDTVVATLQKFPAKAGGL